MLGEDGGMSADLAVLWPAGVTMWERGWLSSNQLFVAGRGPHLSGLIDSGHVRHAEQTLALAKQAVRQAHGEEGLLGRLVNTHLHSDHCGGNARLQELWPALETLVPPGGFEAARRWDEDALSYRVTGQSCPRFVPDAALAVGGQVQVGALGFEVHAAPGHDPDAVLLFEPASGLLVSGDALWADGFGVVFPELEGAHAFEAVGDTLDAIARLPVRVVVPGHGPAFGDVDAAVQRARLKLSRWQQEPLRHAMHASKVLVKYHVMECGGQSEADVRAWLATTPYPKTLHQRFFADQAFDAWAQALLDGLCRQGALRRDEGWIHDAD